uniref:TACO1/YebC-like second and third domain-containing protein n=1 Tax=Ceratitis capitata TaxID=7213 RepID=W8C4H7_CERCA
MCSFRTANKEANPLKEQPTTSRRHAPDSPVIVTKNTMKRVKYENLLAQSVSQAPLECRLAHKLRLAVYEGNSTNPRQNRFLKTAIRRVREQGLSLHAAQQIINNYGDTRNSQHRQILQIRYNRRVFLICTLRTANVVELKSRLMPLIRAYNASFVNVIHNFHSSATIEAIISLQTSLDFSNLEGSIARDAHACKAQECEMVDYETGAVNFKCEPSEMDAVLKRVRAKGYTVLHTEYSFKPKKFIKLEESENEKYKKFRTKLMKTQDFDVIFDNVVGMDEEEIETGIATADCVVAAV